jgi:hypothetical protein
MAQLKKLSLRSSVRVAACCLCCPNSKSGCVRVLRFGFGGALLLLPGGSSTLYSLCAADLAAWVKQIDPAYYMRVICTRTSEAQSPLLSLYGSVPSRCERPPRRSAGAGGIRCRSGRMGSTTLVVHRHEHISVERIGRPSLARDGCHQCTSKKPSC